MNFFSKILINFIKIYQYVLSPYIGRECRFYPTCSNYSIEAIERFGFFRGSWLMVARIIRCNPWGGSGVDPVPDVFSWFPWKKSSN